MNELNFSPYISVLPNIFITFFIGLLLTPLLRIIGLKFGFATKPKSESDPNERGLETKHHTKTTPRLGEFAMLIPLLTLMWGELNLTTQIFGIVLAIVTVGIMGAFDSKYHLSEFVKLYILTISSILVIFTGTYIDFQSLVGFNLPDIVINNPVISSQISLLDILITLAWLIVVPTALSYVGGIDGLAEGTSAIAILILLLLGIRTGDTLTIVIASLSLGGLLGLIPYNFYPAVIYSEHLIYGYLIAILAIITQGKIPTAILLLAIPLIDFVYVALNRIKKYYRENNKFNLKRLLTYLGTGDRTHLHHKMMELGLSPVQISLIQYVGYTFLGFIALAVSGLYLTFAIIGSILLIMLIFYYINKKLHFVKLNGKK
jgi:UDP-GlcNAc:undecaprenyl-phosphate GlcNAc-1-phosphate transferase